MGFFDLFKSRIPNPRNSRDLVLWFFENDSNTVVPLANGSGIQQDTAFVEQMVTFLDSCKSADVLESTLAEAIATQEYLIRKAVLLGMASRNSREIFRDGGLARVMIFCRIVGYVLIRGYGKNPDHLIPRPRSHGADHERATSLVRLLLENSLSCAQHLTNSVRLIPPYENTSLSEGTEYVFLVLFEIVTKALTFSYFPEAVACSLTRGGEAIFELQKLLPSKGYEYTLRQQRLYVDTLEKLRGLAGLPFVAMPQPEALEMQARFIAAKGRGPEAYAVARNFIAYEFLHHAKIADQLHGWADALLRPVTYISSNTMLGKVSSHIAFAHGDDLNHSFCIYQSVPYVIATTWPLWEYALRGFVCPSIEKFPISIQSRYGSTY